MSAVRIKRGATLSLTLAFSNADGSAYGLSGVTLLAHVRDAEENLVATVTPLATMTPGLASLYVQDTSAWPEGLLRMDVLVQPAGGPQSLSQTVGIYVDHAITQLLPGPAPFDPVAS
jgi:hypothetical protein